MEKEALVNYVKQCVAQGHPVSQVKTVLIHQGYPAELIAEVIAAGTKDAKAELQVKQQEIKDAKSGSPIKAPPDLNDDYFMRLTGILFKPLKVLEEFKEEKGIGKPFKFLLYTSIISEIINVFLLFFAGFGFIDIALKAVISFVSGFAIIFGFAGVFHLLVKLFRGRNPFYQTFKAFAYLTAFDLVGSFLIGINLLITVPGLFSILLGLWVFILLVSSLRHYTELKSWKLIVIFVIILLVFVLASFIFAQFFVMSMLSSSTSLDVDSQEYSDPFADEAIYSDDYYPDELDYYEDDYDYYGDEDIYSDEEEYAYEDEYYSTPSGEYVEEEPELVPIE